MSQFAINKNGITNDVGAELFAAFVKGLLPTNGIINAFDNLACAKVNDNLVRLSPGLYNMSGFVTGVKPGTTADLAVDSGTSGYNRIDLVIAEFVRNGGGAGIDTSQIRILKGTSTTGTPVDPTLTQEDINGAGVTRQEALYRLTITGTTLATPELMASMLDNLASVVAMLALKAPLESPALTGTPTVPTAAVDTSTTQAASTAFVTNQASASNPVMDGTVAIGASKRYARADHVHPSDTNKVGKSASAGTLVNYVWSGTQAQYDAIGTKDANTLYFIVG